MRWKVTSWVGIMLVILNLSILLVNGFAANGKIAGKVIDKATKEPLPGANVMVESVWQFGNVVKLETKSGAATDAEGYFVILNIPPGTFNLKATMMGYTEMVKQQVRVNIDRTTTIEFALETKVLEIGTVEVVAEKEIIKPDVAGTQEIILSDRIAEMPILRMDEFMNKIKGVTLVAGNDGQGLSVRGGSIRETDVRIDGISLRDPRSENSYLSLNSTAVEELQVLTGGFEAKYGEIRSGLVNVVTKEGHLDRYSISLKMDYTSKNQRKFFGANPWSDASWIYRVFADTSANGYAYIGTLNNQDVPEELRYFRGWANRLEGRQNYEAIGLKANARLTNQQKRKLWLLQHPQYEYGNKPDMFLEGTLTGPVPGVWLPYVGSFFK
ncbi:TonB-dependent receptor, partial [candidate division KSB1 bacterium]|nr:TonB-dependent receptor [candidate division KSB1 bacterium]